MSRKSPENFPNSVPEVRLGTFTYDPATKELRDAAGDPVHLRRQSTEVLAFLIERRGQVVPKAELSDSVWGGLAVTEDSLVQCISEIRRCLRDRDHRLIRTVSKKGYRLIADPRPPGHRLADPPIPAQPSIAVLAFDDFSTGDDRHQLSDAVAEGMIAELSRFPELMVIARNSSFAFRDRPTPIDEISRRLGVRYVLEGSHQKSGNGLRVTVQLIDAAKGHHLWAETYDRTMADLFAVQDDIVKRVVATVAQKVIRLEGTPARDRGGGRHAALLHHLEARQHLIRFTPEDNAKALAANMAAIAADPAQPYGHVGLAFAQINAHRFGWTDQSPEMALAEARHAAQTALDLAPEYYDSHAAMAVVHLHENDLDRAIARARHALKLNPNDTNAMCDLSEFLAYAGERDEARALLDRAMRLDPLHPDWMRWNMAWLLWLEGDCRGALDTLNLMSWMPPMACRVLAVTHICLGDTAAAQSAVADLLAYLPGYTLADERRQHHGKFRNERDLERMLSGLEEAGLPR